MASKLLFAPLFARTFVNDTRNDLVTPGFTTIVAVRVRVL